MKISLPVIEFELLRLHIIMCLNAESWNVFLLCKFFFPSSFYKLKQDFGWIQTKNYLRITIYADVTHNEWEW